MSILYPCIYYTEDGRCKKFTDEEAVSWCVLSPCEYEKPSNGDLIRAMPDEELAKMLPSKSMWNCPPDIKTRGGCPGQCVPCWLDWLKQGVDDDEGR